jgi:hypothetical protein
VVEEVHNPPPADSVHCRLCTCHAPHLHRLWLSQGISILMVIVDLNFDRVNRYFSIQTLQTFSKPLLQCASLRCIFNFINVFGVDCRFQLI